MAIDRSDIQGNVLRAYGNSYPCTLVCVRPRVGCRGWPGVAGRARRDGLERRGVARREAPLPPQRRGHVRRAARARGSRGCDRARSPTSSVQGMAGRSDMLGDLGPSAPEHWDGGLGTGAAHVLVTVNARRREEVEEEVAGLRAAIDRAAGVSVVHEQHAELLAPAGPEAGGSAAGAVRVRRRRRPAGDRGGLGQRGGRRRRAAQGRGLAAAGARRVRARVSRRGHARRSPEAPAERAGGPARPVGDLRGLPQAPPGRGAVSQGPARRRGSVLRRATRSCSRPRSSGGGGTGRRSSIRRTVPIRSSPRPPRGATTSVISPPTSTASDARLARTSGARIHATGSAGRGWTIRGD